MKAGRFLISILTVAMFAAVSLPNAVAQNVAGNGPQHVALTMSASESITLAITSGASYVIEADGTANPTPITVLTTYNLSSATPRSVYGFAWVGSATAALTNGTTNIPSTMILEAYTATGTNSAFNGSNSGPCKGTWDNTWAIGEPAGTSCPGIYDNVATNVPNVTGSGTVTTQITLTQTAYNNTTPAPPGNYTGDFYVQAVAN
jgi:hypothetical protein